MTSWTQYFFRLFLIISVTAKINGEEPCICQQSGIVRAGARVAQFLDSNCNLVGNSEFLETAQTATIRGKCCRDAIGKIKACNVLVEMGYFVAAWDDIEHVHCDNQNCETSCCCCTEDGLCDSTMCKSKSNLVDQLFNGSPEAKEKCNPPEGPGIYITTANVETRCCPESLACAGLPPSAHITVTHCVVSQKDSTHWCFGDVWMDLRHACPVQCLWVPCALLNFEEYVAVKSTCASPTLNCLTCDTLFEELDRIRPN